MLPMLDSALPTPAVHSYPTNASQGQTTTTATTTIQAQRSHSLPHLSQSQPPDGTLRLRGGPIHPRRVTWSEEVVDNEGLGRKKSKVCCIFRRNREFGESSDESSSCSDSSDSSDSDIGDAKRKGRAESGKRGCDKDHSHDHDHDHNHHQNRKRGRGPSRRPPSPNAYEKMPKNITKNKEGGSGQTMVQG